MVKATRKPLEQIFDMVKGYRRVLVVGCGGCTSVCLAGGQREAIDLADELATCARDGAGAAAVRLRHRRAPVQSRVPRRDRGPRGERRLPPLHGLRGGGGLLADAFPRFPVFPALDTMFVGVDRDVGSTRSAAVPAAPACWATRAGICPVTRCSKGVLNGPCGGTREDGSCELADGIHCAWHDIHEQAEGPGQALTAADRPPAHGMGGPGTAGARAEGLRGPVPGLERRRDADEVRQQSGEGPRRGPLRRHRRARAPRGLRRGVRHARRRSCCAAPWTR